MERKYNELLPQCQSPLERIYEQALGSSNPAVAVFPFVNMSSDPEQEYFSDGITEDIITELSRFRDLMVIGRNPSLAFEGASVDIGKVTRELGVAYVLVGSVRRSGTRVRITAQLTDVCTGRSIWSEHLRSRDH